MDPARGTLRLIGRRMWWLARDLQRLAHFRNSIELCTCTSFPVLILRIGITVQFVGIGADRDGGWENWSSRGACTTNHDLFINGRFVELLQSLPTMESLLTERTGIILWTTDQLKLYEKGQQSWLTMPLYFEFLKFNFILQWEWFNGVNE